MKLPDKLVCRRSWLGAPRWGVTVFFSRGVTTPTGQPSGAFVVVSPQRYSLFTIEEQSAGDFILARLIKASMPDLSAFVVDISAIFRASVEEQCVLRL
jgi:hypothetical protein